MRLYACDEYRVHGQACDKVAGLDCQQTIYHLGTKV